MYLLIFFFVFICTKKKICYNDNDSRGRLVDMNYNYNTYADVQAATKMFTNSFILIIAGITLILGLIQFIGQWKMLKKLGKPGWSILVPIYNGWVYLECGGFPGWLVLIPVANSIGIIVATVKIPQRFGKGIGFGLGNLFFPYIFTPILGFGSAQPIDAVQPEPEVKPDLMAENQGEIKADGSIDLMSAPNTPVSEPVIVPEEPKNEFTEAPALNISENVQEQTPMPEPIPQNIQNTATPDDIPSAFDMPMPAANNVAVNNTTPVENVPVEPTPVVDTPAVPITPVVEAPIAPVTPIVETPVVAETPAVEPAETAVNSEPAESVSNIEPLNVEEKIEVPTVPVIEDKPIEVPVVETPVVPVIEEQPVVTTLPADQVTPVSETAPEQLNSIEDDIKEATIELPKMVNAEVNENITATKKCPFCGAENEYSSKSCVTCGNNLN